MKKISLLIAMFIILTSCSNRGAIQSQSSAQDSDQPQTHSERIVTDAVEQNFSSQLAQIDDMEYTVQFPQEFNITRPADDITTTDVSYYIMGTSEPSEDVYIDETKIEQRSKNGLFGVFVELEEGVNTFVFSQEDQTKTVTITRGEDTPSQVQVIEDIIQSSMYPANNIGVNVGDEIILSCTAPSGADITAVFGDITVQLEQVATADTGVPARYTAQMEIAGDFEENIVVNAGEIKYNMTYNGISEEYTSTGVLKVAGENAHLAVQIMDYIGVVYSEPEYYTPIREILKQGCSDYILGQENDFYKLESGGYLAVSAGDILEGEIDLKKNIAAVDFTGEYNNETYVFKGGANCSFLVDYSSGEFKLDLYNVNSQISPDISQSLLYNNVQLSQTENGAEYIFTQKTKGNIWGYSIINKGEDMYLRFSYKPELSDSDTPLENMSIVLDPGHGGNDPGALGVAGSSGPDENLANVEYVLKAKESLEKLGATVMLTRESEEVFLTLDERLEFFENSGADLFISIHQNSLPTSVDASAINGMEAYYYSDLSYNTTSKLMRYLTGSLGRDHIKTEQSIYRVTLLPYAPSFLWEMGFMSNIDDYELITNPNYQQLAADVLAQALLNLFE